MEKENLIALMNMFMTIKKLTKYYSFDQAVDVMDIYFKTNDQRYLTKEDGIREFVVNNNIREKIFPIIDGNYQHLMDFIDEFGSSNKKSR